MTLTSSVMLAAALATLTLGGVGLIQRPRGRLQWSFALGMGIFAAEVVASHILLTWPEAPEDRLYWLQLTHAAGTLLPVPWAFFVAALGCPDGGRQPLVLRVGLGLLATLAVAFAAATLLLPSFQTPDIPGPFHAGQMRAVGYYSTLLQLLATIGILAGLEVALRASRGGGRWRVKYLILGLGAVFLVRFYFLSQALLFRVLMGVYLTAEAATLLVGSGLIGIALLRDRRMRPDLAVSRHVLYRSVVAGVLGLYLLAVGVLGWVLNRQGIPEELLWSSLVIFVSAVALGALLLSENVRWRVKRYIATNFYRSKYDYREQWSRFTTRLTSLISLNELAPALLEAVTDSVGASRCVLYLADERTGELHSATTVGRGRPVLALSLTPASREALIRERVPLALEQSPRREGSSGPGRPADELADLLAGTEALLAVPLVWRDTLRGLLVIGPERTGAPYTPEDLELLATVAEQGAGALVTARLSETTAQTREFETFHRLTSFVIHDLKNAVSSLSLLAHNAERHFDDREFQRDALRTIGRTVERMRELMARLASSRETQQLAARPVHLPDLVREILKDLVVPQSVTLVQEMREMPPIEGDPEALKRVVQNLLSNAFEALSGEGMVTVRAHEQDGAAVLTVSDTGCGIPEPFLRESLFTPFRTTKRSGWGIGLFQVKNLVEAHGGTIQVESRVGSGTTFTIRLPYGGSR